MMKICDWSTCENWAQWILTTADKKTRNLCSCHKDELERQLNLAHMETGAKFRFSGAMPDGYHDPQSTKNPEGTPGNR